jgi:hypothetical protein
MGPADQAEIDLAATQLTSLLARHMPEFLKSLVLVGSAADGDFHAGKSDLDFVAVMRTRPTEEELDGLTIVHRLYSRDMTLARLDGIWVTDADLAAGPDAAPDGPSTEAGAFFAETRGNRNPVAWFTLADQGKPIPGDLDRTAIWRDPARLRSWTRENVESYWARTWLAESQKLLAKRGLRLLGGDGVMWGVLGISRLHYTLATGKITSKTGAGEHALTAFEPRWRRIIEESLRIRQVRGQSLYGSPFERRKDALAFVAMAIEAIRKL